MLPFLPREEVFPIQIFGYIASILQVLTLGCACMKEVYFIDNIYIILELFCLFALNFFTLCIDSSHKLLQHWFQLFDIEGMEIIYLNLSDLLVFKLFFYNSTKFESCKVVSFGSLGLPLRSVLVKLIPVLEWPPSVWYIR